MKLQLQNIEVYDVESQNLDDDKFRVTLMQDTGKNHFEGCVVVDVDWESSSEKIVNPVLINAWDENDNKIALQNWDELKSKIESILLNDQFFMEFARDELATW